MSDRISRRLSCEARQTCLGGCQRVDRLVVFVLRALQLQVGEGLVIEDALHLIGALLPFEDLRQARDHVAGLDRVGRLDRDPNLICSDEVDGDVLAEAGDEQVDLQLVERALRVGLAHLGRLPHDLGIAVQLEIADELCQVGLRRDLVVQGLKLLAALVS